ncbi:MAG: galactose mutarotase, partial [Gammaproteobacteria bacterium]|nr:galactose mutarotase [Gammaproteobacteria bacterium]
MMPITASKQETSRASDIRQFRLRNKSGFEVALLNYGATIQSIRVPLPDGSIDAIIGYENPEDYLDDTYYMGSTQGRYGNRIEDARLNLEGRVYQLQETPGQKGHCLHGGSRGFSKRVWQAQPAGNGQSISFTLVSADGDQGFPGQLTATVSYSLLEDWKLAIDVHAITDSTTVVNLVNHAYFNLNKDDSPIDNHHVSINADRFTPLKNNMIPTGEKRNVAGTLFDFRQPVRFSDRSDHESNQLRIGMGFDHNFILHKPGDESVVAASAWSPQSGLALNVYTTQPGLQLYTGQYLDHPFQPLGGFCLETQGFPNAPNTAGFPNTVLRAGETYQQRTIY